MAASVAAASIIPLPEFAFLRPETSQKIRIPLSKLQFQNSRYNLFLRIRFRAVQEERIAVLKEQKRNDLLGDEVNGFNLNGNRSGFGYNGSVPSSNGSANVVLDENGTSNGSLVKYAGGNGAATKTVEGEVSSCKSEERRKKKVEEIGKEEAWFKQSGRDNIQVSVAPGGRWNRFKTYSTIQRTLEIWSSVLTFLFKAWLINQKFMYRGGMTEQKKILKWKALAKWLKESILRLGPTFIKIGQQFSTRVDILAQEYVDRLSELQDQVPPFSSEIAVSIIEEELGAPVNDIFDRFDYEPIAAASLGQVHRARLKGLEVVVKVQRPGLKDLFDIDFKNLRVIAEYLQKPDPKSDGAKRDWVAIYDECARVLYQEIDYTKEAENAELFANNFKGMAYVKVPTIYWEYTTPQVLTMEYVPGIKINRIKALDQLGVDRQRLSRYAVESYLEQILSHGFFHADPHPGNIAVDDVNGGWLIFYDFGMMGSISPNIREGLLEVFYGVYEKDPDKVLQAMIQIVVLVPTGDMTAVRRTAQFFLNRCFQTFQDFKKRWDRQSCAFYNVFRLADRVEKLAEVIQFLEQGDLKLRVRTLESERAFQPVAAVQKTVGSAVAAGSFINLATILYLNSIRVPAMTAYLLSAFFTIQVLFSILKVKKLDQQERLITRTA
ncbi:protein ACTIVITY OF BC1 COMPLEX KINASE 8, chloroplastic-like [Telopea speciosissima]|uniref:protein ACTIVITY OF BC1 COMPLEX KINASE 8, chloroplastic-like n=1 Tax=Telopea speciosissima TaxID=54955 RepID=UPI001CC69780|nr:protein ACTIVITY OF BC1 COMPLEX KINASE 8, chloroplastic-like [Telopea speciosissima]